MNQSKKQLLQRIQKLEKACKVLAQVNQTNTKQAEQQDLPKLADQQARITAWATEIAAVKLEIKAA